MRKDKSKKREILPDPKFSDQLVTQFVNNLMLSGKKNTSFKKSHNIGTRIVFHNI